MKENEVLARFMGYEYGEIWYETSKDETQWQRDNKDLIDELGIKSVGEYWINKETKDWFEADELNFNNDWRQLMPVWYKFRDLKFEDAGCHLNYKIQIVNAIVNKGPSPKEACKRLSEAIEWYNANKQQL